MKIKTKQLGITDYRKTFEAMKAFTERRSQSTADELWLTQHRSVFTQGQAGKAEHILQTSSIPIVQSDRGGQVTYHGQGQIILYTLIDIRRLGLGVRQMVSLIENSIITTLDKWGITSVADPKAPGVYVDGEKIASLGLRVRQGKTYHGLALNVDMNLAPFQLINPCGYYGLKMTQMSHYANDIDCQDVENQLISCFVEQLFRE